MPVKDTFQYAARWDSVGLDCSNCTQFKGPAKWLDVKIESFCTKHKISLRIGLGKNGYKQGEWFCKSFEDYGSAFPPAVKHFNSIKAELHENILYGFYGPNGYLLEYNFNSVSNWVPDA